MIKIQSSIYIGCIGLNGLSPQPNQQPSPTQPTKLSTSKLAMGQHVLNVWGIHYVLSNIIGEKTRNPKAIRKFLKNSDGQSGISFQHRNTQSTIENT